MDNLVEIDNLQKEGTAKEQRDAEEEDAWKWDYWENTKINTEERRDFCLTEVMENGDEEGGICFNLKKLKYCFENLITIIFLFSAKKLIEEIGTFIKSEKAIEDFNRYQELLREPSPDWPKWRRLDNFYFLKRMKLFSYKAVNYQKEMDFLKMLVLRKCYS